MRRNVTSECRHALITGGSSGIGLALARRLAAAGYDLSLIARREALLADAAAGLVSHFQRPDQRVGTYSADVADPGQAAAAVAAAAAALGTPDLVVTSAGIAVPGYFEELPLEAFARSMAVNYFGSLHVVREALPAMRARGRGRIVLISSGAGLAGLFGYSTYCPTKFALRGLAEGLRAELKPDGVAVSIVYPPDVDTPMLAEEEKTKPEETRAITATVPAWSADAVAAAIIRGVARGAFAITPGLAMTLMHRLPGVALPALHWYADRLVARVRRRRRRAGNPGLGGGVARGGTGIG
jgi:3-dehydrosphinganine reductase